MTKPTDPGVALANAAEFLTRRHLTDVSTEGHRTLDDLAANLDHLDGTKADLRRALAHLAAQLHAARTEGDIARGRDAIFALTRIREVVAGQGDWFDRNHGGS